MAEERQYSSQTTTAYNRCLASIEQLFELHTQQKFRFPLSYQTDSDKIIEILRLRYEKQSAINFISAILWKLRTHTQHVDGMDIPATCILYSNHAAQLKEEKRQAMLGKEFKLTEREQKTFMKWEDILVIYDKIRNELDRSDLDTISYDRFLDFVMVSLYVLQPPVRADYANMRWFIADEFVPDDIAENYCVLQTNPRFVFQQYKTVHSHGVVTVPICDELHQILIDWCYVNDSDYLLARYVKSMDKLVPMKENTLTKRMGAIFVRHGGKPVNLGTFRHSFVSYHSKHDQDLHRKQKHAEQMMHTPAVADLYYRRMVYNNDSV